MPFLVNDADVFNVDADDGIGVGDDDGDGDAERIIGYGL